MGSLHADGHPRPYRLVLPVLLLVAAVATGTAGDAPTRPRAPTPAGGVALSPAPDEAPPDGAAHADLPPNDLTPGDPTSGRPRRPADALTGWAAPLADRLGIPAVALAAYGYAELAVATSSPGCRLRWTTLAGIGKIESGHGRAHAALRADGRALPTIVGAPLDGRGGRMSIPDTDSGRLDGDRTWDRAVGPMQFIPSTWRRWAADADGDGTADIDSVHDAALAAARYLCAGRRDLSTPEGWWAGIMSYNAVPEYGRAVHAAANDYGLRSRA